MVHQIKAQLTASIEKIERQTKIENLCSKLSATLAMANALDKLEGLECQDSFFDRLYVYVDSEIDVVVSMIRNYEKKEEPTE